MAQGDHIHPAGTSLAYGPTAGSESITVGELLDIEPPSVKRGKSNDTTLGNTNAVGTNSAGWGEPGEAKATVYLTGAMYTALKTIEQARTTKNWKVTFPFSPNESSVHDTLQFAAWIGELKITKAEQMSEEKIKLEISLQMTGDCTYTTGS